MARSSNRVGLFSSHRGRAVKKGLIVVGATSMALFIGNGMLGGGEVDSGDTTETTTAFVGDEEPKEPAVAAPISRPFEVPVEGGVQDVEGGDIYGEAVEQSDSSTSPDGGEDESEDATDELQRSATYSSAVALTTKFAEAYGTHSFDQTAQEWVDSLPGLSPAAKTKLLVSAKDAWPDVADRRASSTATPVAESIAPIYSRDGGATVQLAVRVTKKTSYEGKAGYASDSYAITLKRAAGSSDGWTVVSVS